MSSLSQADGVVPWLWEWGWISRATYTRISVYEFVTCAMFLILFINKNGYELAYGKVYKLSIRLRVFQVMASACALT